MADATPNRLGQINNTGATDALFLKMFSGETLSAFAETNVALGLTQVRTITSGKSAQFPVFGKGDAEYHTPGTEILGGAMPQNEKNIVIDDLLIAHKFIANIDEAKNHYDVRAPYSREVGRALAKAMDINILRTGVLNARSAAAVSGGFGGTIIEGATLKTSAAALVAAIQDAAVALDQKDVPETDRYVFVTPAEYSLLVKSDLLDRDFSPENGSRAAHTIYRVAGMAVVKTNNIPRTNVTTGPTAYRGDFTKTVALCQHVTAVGTVKLLDLNTEMNRDFRRRGWLVLAEYACGHGSLRPEAGVELALPAS